MTALSKLPKTSLALVVCLAACGCVERLLQVRTEPTGSEVFVNGAPVVVTREEETDDGQREKRHYRAITPVDVPFDAYGTYEIVVRAPGCESVSKLVPIKAPFFDYPIIDFFAELVPWTIRSHHEIRITLPPSPEASDTNLDTAIERAESLRAELDARALEMESETGIEAR